MSRPEPWHAWSRWDAGAAKYRVVHLQRTIPRRAADLAGYVVHTVLAFNRAGAIRQLRQRPDLILELPRENQYEQPPDPAA
jgi:hypothetical protein